MAWKQEWDKGQAVLHLKDVQKWTKTLEKCLPRNTWSYKTNSTFPASLADRCDHLTKLWSIKHKYLCGNFWEIAKNAGMCPGPLLSFFFALVAGGTWRSCWSVSIMLGREWWVRTKKGRTTRGKGPRSLMVVEQTN